MLKSTITVLSIVAASKVMTYSGMITVIANVLVKATGTYFPLVSPLIGMLGTFVTGSDTSANVLFGALQKEVATSIAADPYWLAASNTAGATAGKMISPQSIAVATSATGLAGYEGKILKSTAKFCIGYVIVLGLIVYFGGMLIK
jgi:lactate permease